MDLNLLVMSGRLAADPEYRTFESGTRLVRLLLTVRSETPRRRVDVIPITVWEPSEDLARGSLVRGQRLWAAGSLQRRFWQDDGGRRSRLEAVADHVSRRAADLELEV